MLQPDDPRHDALALIDAFAATPQNSQTVALFRDFVLEHPDCFERGLSIGHLTGSAWLVNRAGTHVLLTHHRKLGRWLQLGGHADGDSDLARVALREAEEESGLVDLRVEPAIYDLDRHWIPARANEPAHWHYDVRFVVRCERGEDFVVSEESHDLAWREIAEVAEGADYDDSVRRMAQRWRG